MSFDAPGLNVHDREKADAPLNLWLTQLEWERYSQVTKKLDYGPFRQSSQNQPKPLYDLVSSTWVPDDLHVSALYTIISSGGTGQVQI